MAKKKSQKKFSSSSENPFNIKINRNKHTILGQKVKGTRGRPGVSKSIGNARRKEDFHKKKILSQKANKYLDKRLLSSSQTYEDPATARLIQERKKKLKKNIFNLNDEESLTHKGVPLISDNLADEVIADSDDEEPLDSQFVRQAHFGGFSGDSVKKSRQEIIDELIFESKKRNQERKMARELNADLIEKLDQEWKESHASTLPILKAARNAPEISEKNDPFDILLNELKFEKRTTPTGRLKTPEQIAKEEFEKQNKLEEERRKRMNPEDNQQDKNNHLSSDSIYDGLDIQFEPIDDQEDNDLNGTNDKNFDDDTDGDSSDSDKDEFLDIEMEDNKSEAIDDKMLIIPDSLDSFISIVNGHDLHDVVDNLLKSVINNKTKKNKEKLEHFFAILIQYAMKTSINPSKTIYIMDCMDCLLTHLYTLAEISPLETSNILLTFMDEEQEIFQSSKGKKMKRHFPRFQCLILFKIISKIYSVSDFRHPVVTPAIIFMCDILSCPYATSYENTLSRLFICKILYDCISFSKRYIPEVFFFLHKTLELAFDKNKNFNLHIDQEISMQEKIELPFKMPGLISGEIKVSILFEIITLLQSYAQLYTDLLSFKEIFSPALLICSKLPTIFSNFLNEEISKFVSFVKSVEKKYKPLTYDNKKPVPLKLFEPSFDSKFTKKKDDIKKKRKLVKSVEQKIKKEERGMLREVRRENQVIASEKLREKLEADEERKRKVKQLYQELSMQEGEYKKFVKKK